MAAHIEWVTGDRIGVIRIGDNFLNFGDPYEFSSTVVIVGNTADFIGAPGMFNPKWREDIFKVLLESNVEFMTWDRKRKDGSTHRVGPLPLSGFRDHK